MGFGARWGRINTVGGVGYPEFGTTRVREELVSPNTWAGSVPLSGYGALTPGSSVPDGGAGVPERTCTEGCVPELLLASGNGTFPRKIGNFSLGSRAPEREADTSKT